MGRKFISNVKGVGVSSIIKEYYASTSSSELTGGTWMNNIPTLTESLYLWSRWKVVLTNGETTTTEAVQEGIAGADLSNLAKVVGELGGSVEDLDTALKKQSEDVKKQFDDLNENLGAVAEEDVVPIEKGGHGKTTAKEGLLALGGMSMGMVWKNPNPTDPFQAKKIELDLSEYDAVIVKEILQADSESDGYDNILCFVGDVYSKSQVYYAGIHRRKMTVENTGVTFTNCVRYGTYMDSSETSTQNNRFVPVEIYGIKGIKPLGI